jgi:hypothetical protein
VVLEAVALIAASQRRARRRTLVFVAVLVAIVSGLSMALVAGAVRSSSVVERFYARAVAPDVSVYDASSVFTQDEIEALPGVTSAGTFAYVALVATKPDGSPSGFVNGAALDFSKLDPTTRVLEGTLPRPGHLREVAVNRAFVDLFHRSVGDVVTVRTFAADQAEEVQNGVYDPRGPTYRFRIAAVVRVPSDIGVDEVRAVGRSAQSSGNILGLPTAFYEAHRDEFLNYGGEYNLQLAEPSAARDLEGELASITPAGVDPPLVFPAEDDSHRGALDTPVRVETTALLALGIGIALAGVIALALVLRTEQRIHDDDTPTLRALGASSRQIGGAAALRTLPSAVAGTVAAVVLAVALSPFFPIGIGRQLELDGGVRIDPLVLGLGIVVTVVAVVGFAFVFAHPWASRRDRPSRRSGATSWLAAADAPVGLTLGAYLAFARSGARRSAPSRPVIVGAALLVTLMTGLAVYGAGIDHAYASPAARGWEWDAVVGNVNFPLRQSTAEQVVHDRAVVAATRANYGQASINGQSTEVLAFDPHGDAPPIVTAGRLPLRAHEIALGAATLDRLHARIGSKVRFSVSNGEFAGEQRGHAITARVVGRALPPVFGESDLGDIGIVTLDAISASGGDSDPKLVFVDLRTGGRTAGLRALERRYTEEIHIDAVPARVVTLHRVRSLWRIGFGLLALMLVVLLGYLLAVTMRVRRHDLAVLRTLGLRSRQLTGSLAAQIGIVAVIVLAVGLPLGVLLGHALWDVVTDPIGLLYGGSPVPALAWITVLTVCAAAVAALVAARRARHAPIAEALRAP